MRFHKQVLELDCDRTLEGLLPRLREQVFDTLKRKGAVVGLSGGIDSSLTAALAARALGAERVLGLFLPERDSSPESLRLGRLLADALGIATETEELAPALEAMGCYRRRDAAIREVFPDYGPGYLQKIALHGDILEKERLNFFEIVIQDPSGAVRSRRLPLRCYLQIVAASNMKQRTRTLMEYYHAERLNYAVAGTPNRLEYDQGFFVKGGDGLADFKPIAHLYKTQVYQLARHLGLPAEILERPPTTDTYSMAQSQEEFFFALPYGLLDLLLWALNHGVSAEEAAGAAGLASEQVERVYRDIEQKRRTTRILHLAPLLVEPVLEAGGREARP